MKINKFFIFTIIIQLFSILIFVFFIIHNNTVNDELKNLKKQIETKENQLSNYEIIENKYDEIFKKRETFNDLLLNKEEFVKFLQSIELFAKEKEFLLNVSTLNQNEKADKKIDPNAEKLSQIDEKIKLIIETRSDYLDLVDFIKELQKSQNLGAITYIKISEKEIDEMNFESLSIEEMEEYIVENDHLKYEDNKIKAIIKYEL